MSVYENITAKIISAIETGQATGKAWKMPWHSAGGRPTNITTGRPYRGVNTLALWCEAQDKGYASDTWGTFKQWATQGAQVKKGEKGSLVVFWKDIPKKDDDGERKFVMRTSYAFNASQVDGYEPPVRSTECPDTIPHAEAFISSLEGLDLRFGGGRAFYNPARDFVQMPPLPAFHHTHGYYSTLLHEAAHWTGHPTRLAREFGARFGDEAYAFEELIAELSAAFMCGDLGLSNEPRQDHAEYIAGWLRVLNKDPRAIFKASSEAAKVADFLSSFSEKKEKAA